MSLILVSVTAFSLSHPRYLATRKYESTTSSQFSLGGRGAGGDGKEGEFPSDGLGRGRMAGRGREGGRKKSVKSN